MMDTPFPTLRPLTLCHGHGWGVHRELIAPEVMLCFVRTA
jgi:hypothetical protein